MRKVFVIALAICTGLVEFPAYATFHLNEIIEVFSNPDGTVQYIEFLCTANLQDQMGGRQMTSGANTFTFSSNLPNSSTLNKHFLVATQAFAQLSGAVTPDYIMPAHFFNVNGDTITLVGAITPAFTFAAGQLPVNGVLSLNRNPSTLAFTTATNSPQNYAGQIGSVTVPVLDPNNVYVNLDVVQAGVGTQSSPFNTLAAAVAAANATATIHLAPSASAETFTGAQAIVKALTLVNSNPPGGLVRVGVFGARDAAMPQARTGFISSPRTRSLTP